jgi:hypothetical protein
MGRTRAPPSTPSSACSRIGSAKTDRFGED